MEDESNRDLAERLRMAARSREPRTFAPPLPPPGPDVLLAFARLVEATGECRVAAGHAVVVPVLTAEGLRWECSHEQTHRSQIVVPLEGAG